MVAISTKFFGSGLPASILLKSKSKGFKVGVGMMARSEVAFITAGVGITSGIIDNNIYSTLVFVILATVFISPILLRIAYSKN
jgi:Kef-type K+ transport system membrane component KefB